MIEKNRQPQVVNLRSFRVDLQHHALLNEAGAVVELRPQAMDLLCLLAQNAGKVMEKQELLAQVWKGLLVTDDSLVQAIGDIRRAIDDQSHQVIRTVPRRGYRLIEHEPGAVAGPDTLPPAEPAVEVQPTAPMPEVPKPTTAPGLLEALATPDSAISGSSASGRKRLAWMAALLLMATLVYLGWHMQGLAPPPRLSIVVLPFVNSSGDPAKEYIADNITEDITVQLSRTKGALVIGRGTAFTYKGKALDLKAIAKELNVRYILQGTVDRNESGYHLTAQLVDGNTGSNLWADSVEVPLEKKADIRQWVAAHITGILRIKLVEAEASESAKRVSPASEDLDMQGYVKLITCNGKDSCLEPHRLFSKAIQADPNNNSAYAHRVMIGVNLLLNFGVPRSGEIYDQLIRDIAHLESLESLDPIGHRALARARVFQGRTDEALQHIDQVLQMDPNDVDALRNKPLYLILSGRATEAIPVAMQGMELSPKDPMRDDFYFFICKARIALGEYEESAVWCEKAFATYSYFWPLVYLVADYTALGEVDKAAVAKEKLMQLNPQFSISWYKNLKLSSNPIWLRQVEAHVFTHLRRAGIPE